MLRGLYTLQTLVNYLRHATSILKYLRSHENLHLLKTRLTSKLIRSLVHSPPLNSEYCSFKEVDHSFWLIGRQYFVLASSKLAKAVRLLQHYSLVLRTFVGIVPFDLLRFVLFVLFVLFLSSSATPLFHTGRPLPTRLALLDMSQRLQHPDLLVTMSGASYNLTIKRDY